jgi:hypothetical protein
MYALVFVDGTWLIDDLEVSEEEVSDLKMKI